MKMLIRAIIMFVIIIIALLIILYQCVSPKELSDISNFPRDVAYSDWSKFHHVLDSTESTRYVSQEGDYGGFMSVRGHMVRSTNVPLCNLSDLGLPADARTYPLVWLSGRSLLPTTAVDDRVHIWPDVSSNMNHAIFRVDNQKPSAGSIASGIFAQGSFVRIRGHSSYSGTLGDTRDTDLSIWCVIKPTPMLVSSLTLKDLSDNVRIEYGTKPNILVVHVHVQCETYGAKVLTISEYDHNGERQNYATIQSRLVSCRRYELRNTDLCDFLVFSSLNTQQIYRLGAAMCEYALTLC